MSKRTREKGHNISSEEIISSARVESRSFGRSLDDPVRCAILVRKLKDAVKAQYKKYRIGIITALPKEAAAVERIMQSQELYHVISDITYYSLKLRSTGGGYNFFLLVKAPKMGNSSSAIAATSVIKDFHNIVDIIMVGIAGGAPDPSRPDVDVHLGDIVVSDGKGLVQYDMTKIENDKITVRSVAPPPSAYLLSYVGKLETDRIARSKRPWEKYIQKACGIENGARPSDEKDCYMAMRAHCDYVDKRRRKGTPVIHYGTIGSANSLLKNKRLRDELKAQFGVLAVEMEGSGVADAAWFSGTGYLIIRGICDYCDENKNDEWQGYAAAAAAGYLKALLEILPTTDQ